MKQHLSAAVFALLYSSEVSAVKIRDIFDAYDIESKKELQNHDDNIDPAQLAAEIGGDKIAKDVKSATSGVSNTQMLQLYDDIEYIPDENIYLSLYDDYKPRRIIDADGDGVEDNVHKSQKELDRFRKMVFGVAVEDVHNTKNGELPGHVRFGEDHEPGVDPW